MAALYGLGVTSLEAECYMLWLSWRTDGSSVGWVSKEKLAEATGRSIRTIRRGFSGLVGKGALFVESKTNQGCLVYRTELTGADRTDRVGRTELTGHPDRTDRVTRTELSAIKKSSKKNLKNTSKNGSASPVEVLPLVADTQRDGNVLSHLRQEEEIMPEVSKEEMKNWAYHTVIGFPLWLGGPRQKTADEIRAITIPLLRAYLSRWSPESVLAWCRIATYPELELVNPAAWLYKHLDGYARKGWKPTDRRGLSREWHEALLQGEYEKAIPPLLKEINGKAGKKAMEEEVKTAEESNAAMLANFAIMAEDPEVARVLANVGVTAQSVLTRSESRDPFENAPNTRKRRTPRRAPQNRAGGKLLSAEDQALMDAQRRANENDTEYNALRPVIRINGEPVK
ncbi:MAG: hypothetical protein H8E31_11545 [Planctomycetes bacterium]|nr:hypothetical protein [Planctomycetota bacterium]